MTFERIKQIDFELDELGEFEEALIEKEYNEFESAFSKQKELKSKLQILKNTPILPSSLVRQRKNLEERKKNLEKPIVNEEFEMTSSSEELLRDIQRKSEFTEYTNRCELHATNISKLKAKRNEFREAHLRKYGEIKLTIDLDLLYQRGKELENEIEEATKIMNQIDEYKKYKKAKKQYSELEEKIREFEQEEKRVSRLLTASYELTKKIQEAESLAIASLLEELNIRSQEYFELFFPNDPITIQLSSFKENKNAVIKPVINLKISYKGHEIDLNTLSGGERDRVVLVYTLVLVEMFNIPLLILDESTSSLDQELTLTVLEGIKNRFNNKLVLIVAHQIIEGTLDRVIQL
jgi:DNA repair exonuclease SbcCD ATPase subunit